MTPHAERFGRSRGKAIVHAVLLLLLACSVGLGHASAVAQSCSADSQCPNSGRSIASCVGNTLIVRRSVCAGSCREVEERRQDCGSRGLGTVTCSGNLAVRSEGGCNATTASCDNRMDRELCVPSCSCRGNRLIIATGSCTAGVGCGRSITQCKNGCTCKPDPKCL
jgi:hypothetical protein